MLAGLPRASPIHTNHENTFETCVPFRFHFASLKRLPSSGVTAASHAARDPTPGTRRPCTAAGTPLGRQSRRGAAAGPCPTAAGMAGG